MYYNISFARDTIFISSNMNAEGRHSSIHIVTFCEFIHAQRIMMNVLENLLVPVLQLNFFRYNINIFCNIIKHVEC